MLTGVNAVYKYQIYFVSLKKIYFVLYTYILNSTMYGYVSKNDNVAVSNSK